MDLRDVDRMRGQPEVDEKHLPYRGECGYKQAAPNNKVFSNTRQTYGAKSALSIQTVPQSL